MTVERSELKDAIEELVNRRYEDVDGVGSVRVGIVADYLRREGEMDVSRNEVQIACDELVEEDRLIFLKDSGKSGRRYCSTKAPDRTVRRLKEGSGE